MSKRQKLNYDSETLTQNLKHSTGQGMNALFSPPVPQPVTQTEEPPNEPMIPRHHDTVVSRYHDTTTPQQRTAVVEIIRKAVKRVGKEAATYRFTQEEKKALVDLVYTYKIRGVRTSENEITRIAIHFLLEDYHENGEASMLAEVLKELST